MAKNYKNKLTLEAKQNRTAMELCRNMEELKMKMELAFKIQERQMP